MIGARAFRVAGFGALVLAVAPAPGSDPPAKITAAPSSVSRQSPPAVAMPAARRKTSLAFESKTMPARVGTYLDFQIQCAIEGNENQAIKWCPIDFEIDGAAFAKCDVWGFYSTVPGSARCTFLVPELSPGAHTLKAHVPAGPQLEASPAVASTLNVSKAWTSLTATTRVLGSGPVQMGEVTFELRRRKAESAAPFDKLPGRSIFVKIDGVQQANAMKTDASGKSLLVVSALGKPSRTVDLRFEGDDFDQPATSPQIRLDFGP